MWHKEPERAREIERERENFPEVRKSKHCFKKKIKNEYYLRKENIIMNISITSIEVVVVAIDN